MNPDDLALEDHDLRDVFAAFALAGMMAKASQVDVQIAGGPSDFVHHIVSSCYALADAMMIQRDAHK